VPVGVSRRSGAHPSVRSPRALLGVRRCDHCGRRELDRRGVCAECFGGAGKGSGAGVCAGSTDARGTSPDRAIYRTSVYADIVAGDATANATASGGGASGDAGDAGDADSAALERLCVASHDAANRTASGSAADTGGRRDSGSTNGSAGTPGDSWAAANASDGPGRSATPGRSGYAGQAADDADDAAADGTAGGASVSWRGRTRRNAFTRAN
jgi:hypothetical protein